MDGVKNMSKYDKMIALNKQRSGEKIDTAIKAIYKMMDEGEKVTVPKLMQKTGLSRGFFYKNPTVRRQIDRAMEQQAGMVDPKRYIGDIAMKRQVELQQQQIVALQSENEELRKANKRLEKALEKKSLSQLKSMI